MIKNYLTVIEKLESLGKFKQADLVEKYLKTSQTSNLQNPLAGGFFDVTGKGSYFTQQESFNPSVLTGQQSRALDLNNITIAQMSPEEIARNCKTNPEFCMKFKENALFLANSYAQGASAASFNSHLSIIDKALLADFSSGMLPNQVLQEYLQRFEGPIVQQIANVVTAEQDINRLYGILSNGIARTQYFKNISAVQTPVTGTIAKGLSDALQSMKPAPNTTVNPRVIQKYNAIVNDPRFNRYLDKNAFRPI